MEALGARQILQRLAAGEDPANGEVLPAGTVLQHPEVIQALQAALAALESEALRLRRRAALPANVGRPWSETEERALAGEFGSGLQPAEIATLHHRTLAAIEARLERLGLISVQQRRTRNRYVSTAHARAPARAASAAAHGGDSGLE
jgi:hypothetical protein